MLIEKLHNVIKGWWFDDQRPAEQRWSLKYLIDSLFLCTVAFRAVKTLLYSSSEGKERRERCGLILKRTLFTLGYGCYGDAVQNNLAALKCPDTNNHFK